MILNLRVKNRKLTYILLKSDNSFPVVAVNIFFIRIVKHYEK